MAWVVDTSVLLDVRLNDENFGITSATCLIGHLEDGLVLCPVSYIELGPAFRGDHELEEVFLRRIGVSWLEAWTWQDTKAAHRLWADYVARKRPVADVLIEAFTMRFQGLITRNPKHFPAVRTVVP